MAQAMSSEWSAVVRSKLGATRDGDIVYERHRDGSKADRNR